MLKHLHVPNGAQADVFTPSSQELFDALWPQLDSDCKRRLRLACKGLCRAVDLRVRRLEATSEQATVEEMEAAGTRWPMVTDLIVHVRQPNPLTKASLLAMFPKVNALRLEVSGKVCPPRALVTALIPCVAFSVSSLMNWPS